MSGGASMPPDWAVPSALHRAVSDHNQSIWLYIGRLHEAFNDLDRALAAYENVLKHNQSNVQAIVSAALLLMKKDHLSASMTYLMTAVQIEPTNGEAWRALAYSHIMNEDMEKAYHAYSNALNNLRDHRDPHLWFGVGIVYDRIGRLDDALRAFDAVLAISPNFERSDEVYYSIGLIYKEQGNYNMAHSYMSKIVSINSSPGAYAEAWYQIGTLHDLANNVTAATDAYQAALAANTGHTKCLQAFAWLVHKSGNTSRAVDLLNRAITCDDTDGSTFYLMGRVYMAVDEFRVAYDNYQRAVHLDGKNANFWCSIASLYYQRQQYRDAMDAYSRAIQINPNIAEIWYDLGILYEAYSQHNDALDSYRRALELQPQNVRFSQRMAALRSAVATGTSLAKPTDRPLTDGPDMSPTTRSGQRPHIKCDVVQRYGLLPAPPVVQQRVQQTAPVHANQISTIPASRAVSDRPIRTGMPSAINGTGNVAESGLLQSRSVANVSNGFITHSSAMAPKEEHIPLSSHMQRSGVIPNGSGEGLQHSGGRDMRFSGGSSAPTGMIGAAPYSSSQMSSVPQQDSRTGNFSRATASPGYRGSVSQPLEQRPQQPFAQGHPSAEPVRGMTQHYSQPLHAVSGPRNAQDIQNSPTSGLATRDYSQRDENKWPTKAERVPVDSRAFPTSRPGVTSGYSRSEAVVDRNIPGTGIGQPSAFSSMPSHSAGFGNVRGEPTGTVGSAHPSHGPVPAYTATPSHYVNGTHPQYVEGPRSNSAAYQGRGMEASSYPNGKEKDGMGIPMAHGTRPTVSDEPSRHSVSSSHEKIAQGSSFRPAEMTQEAPTHIPTSTPSNVRSHSLPNGERVSVQNDGMQSRVEHPDTSSSRLHLLNPIRDGQRGPSAPVEKADSPVDEEMLPRLPPLPSGVDEQPRAPVGNPEVRVADGRDTKSSLVQRENRGVVTMQQGSGPKGAEAKAVKEEGLVARGTISPPAKDSLRRTESDGGGISNGYNRSHENPSGSHSDIYGGRSASPGMKRYSEGMPISGPARSATQGMLQSENGIVRSTGNGHASSPAQTIGKSSEMRNGAAAATVEDSAHRHAADGHERQLKTVSPLPSNAQEHGSSGPRQVSGRRSPEQGSLSRHSSGQLGYIGSENRAGKQSESYDYGSGRDKMQKSPQTRVPSTGIRSSLQHESSGGLPTLKKPRLQSIGSDGQRVDSTPDQPDGRNGGHVSSLRNPFGSGMSASFSKTLSRSGPSGPIGVTPLKEPGASETTARTANSEGLELKSSVERGEGPAARESPHEEISGLGKRSASAYENGNGRPGGTAEYGRFFPKPAVIGPSIENKVRSPDVPQQQQPRFSGGMNSYRPAMDGRKFGDGSADLNRPKVHRAGGDSDSGNRFSGGDL